MASLYYSLSSLCTAYRWVSECATPIFLCHLTCLSVKSNDVVHLVPSFHMTDYPENCVHLYTTWLCRFLVLLVCWSAIYGTGLFFRFGHACLPSADSSWSQVTRFAQSINTMYGTPSLSITKSFSRTFSTLYSPVARCINSFTYISELFQWICEQVSQNVVELEKLCRLRQMLLVSEHIWYSLACIVFGLVLVGRGTFFIIASIRCSSFFLNSCGGISADTSVEIFVSLLSLRLPS